MTKQQDLVMHDVTSAAYDYAADGWAVVPVPHKKKSPVIDGWQRLRLTTADLSTHFNGHAQNIGILLGEASGGLVDVDLDAPETIQLGRAWLPSTQAVSGRPGKRRSHYWYIAPGLKTKQYKDLNGEMLIELRSTGGQTIAPPSTHPSGEQYVWESSGEPSAIDSAALYLVVARIAAGALLARHWPHKGSRHVASLALIGMLLRGGWSEQAIRDFLSDVLAAAGDDEWQAREANIETTIRRLNNGDTATGARKLAELLSDGERVVAQVREWLNLQSVAQPITATNEVDGRPLSARISEALEGLGYSFRYNQVLRRIEVNGTRLDDDVAAEIRVQMRDRGFRNRQAIDDVCMVLARRHAYHPIRDYLDGLTWNGTYAIGELAACFQCDDPPVTGPDGLDRSLFYTYLYRWMIGAVAKVYEQGQNMMLVLAGPQGIGKSHFAAWLCSPLAPYFVSQSINAEDKDSALRLTSNFIWEVDELDGTIRRSDVAALKGFITRRTVEARPAYARYDIEAPAAASLIGTVNIGTGFLADVTGNRRFYVATINNIDWAYTQHDVNQLWAEAVAAYKAGEPWALQIPEKARQTEVNKGHEVPSLLDDWLETDFEYSDSEEVQEFGLTAAEMVSHMDVRGHVLRGTGRQQAMELAAALAKRGVKKRKIGNQQTYLGVTKIPVKQGQTEVE